MPSLKGISSIIFTFCVLQWSMRMVVSGVIVDDNNDKSMYTKTEDKGQVVSSSILGSIYHKSRQSRCVTCYEDRRYGSDRSRYYSGYATRSGDDRASSWYYPRYDRYADSGYRGSEFDRYGASGADRYVPDRYNADRYGSADIYPRYRNDYYRARPSYDRYESRTRSPHTYERPTPYDHDESRGYGYDNRDRYYGSERDSGYYNRDRYYDRSRYDAARVSGSAGGYGVYDRDYYYDRYSPRHDFRRYHSWDDAYRRQSEYNGSGSGYDYDYYYYDKDNQEDRRYLSETGYHYDPPATSPCGRKKLNCPLPDSGEEGIRITSGTIDSGHYNRGVSQSTYSTNSNTHYNESSKGSSPSAGWSYIREDVQLPRDGSNSGSYASNNNNNNKRERNSDQQSSGYGALLDRGSNLIAIEPVKINENSNESNANSDVQQDKNGQETPEQTGNWQNS